MSKQSNTVIRLICYFGGMLIMTLGVAVSVKADLGVTPLSSIPYTITVITGMDLGIATILFSIVAVIAQMLLLRKDFKPVNLLQVPVSVIFGMFLSVGNRAVGVLPDPSSFAMKFLLMLISTVIVAVGVFLYVPAGFITLPPDAFMVVVAQITKKKFSTVKVICDVSMVTVSLVSCLIAIHSLGSVGVGTVVSAFLVGLEVKGLTRLLGDARDRLLLREEELAPASDNPLLNIMKKDVYVIEQNATMEQALRMMMEKKVSGLPVVDEAQNLVGFISDGDIIREFAGEHSLFINSHSFEKMEFNAALKSNLTRTVSSLQHKKVITVNASDDLSDVCYKLVEHKVKKAPVMQNGKMIGIINSSNIIKYAVSLIDS